MKIKNTLRSKKFYSNALLKDSYLYGEPFREESLYVDSKESETTIFLTLKVASDDHEKVFMNVLLPFVVQADKNGKIIIVTKDSSLTENLKEVLVDRLSFIEKEDGSLEKTADITMEELKVTSSQAKFKLSHLLLRSNIFLAKEDAIDDLFNSEEPSEDTEETDSSEGEDSLEDLGDLGEGEEEPSMLEDMGDGDSEEGGDTPEEPVEEEKPKDLDYKFGTLVLYFKDQRFVSVMDFYLKKHGFIDESGKDLFKFINKSHSYSDYPSSHDFFRYYINGDVIQVESLGELKKMFSDLLVDIQQYLRKKVIRYNVKGIDSSELQNIINDFFEGK